MPQQRQCPSKNMMTDHGNRARILPRADNTYKPLAYLFQLAWHATVISRDCGKSQEAVLGEFVGMGLALGVFAGFGGRSAIKLAHAKTQSHKGWCSGWR